MILQIIFVVAMYPVLLILYFAIKGAGEAKNGYSFGVRMKAEWMKDAEIEKILADYQRRLKQITAVLAAVPLVTFLIPYFSISFTIWMLWLLAVIAIPGIPYIAANRSVKEVKQCRGWQCKNTGSVRAEIIDTGEVRCVRLRPFLLPALLGAAAAAYSVYRFSQMGLLAVSFVIVTFAALTALFYLLAVWMDTQRIPVISNEREVNVNYARDKKNIWKYFWIVSAWMNTAFTVFSAGALGMEFFGVDILLWGTIIYSFILILLLVWVLRQTASIEHRYAPFRNIQTEEEHDECWIWGIFYYNRMDRHTMVAKRAGIGTTVNMATPAGMGLGITGAVGILIIPICCIWIILEEFTPIHLEAVNDMLTAEHLRTEYVIPLQEMENLTLLDEKPEWSKVSGTGMENLSKGTYYIRNEGKCEVFLNPQNAVIMKFEAEGKTYYMGGYDDKETMEIYKWLCGEEE